jgi:hypothetical protein
MMSLLLLSYCGVPEVEVGLDADAKSAFVSLPGVIAVKLWAGEQTVQFEIERGKLAFVDTVPLPLKEAAEDFRENSGAERGLPPQERFVYGQRQLTSPEGSRLSVIGYSVQNPDVPAFAIIDTPTKTIVAEISGEPNRRIGMFAWSPDSRMLAVIESTSESRVAPRAILSGCAGHPVHFQTYYLAIYDRTGKLVTSTRLATGLPNSSPQIVWTD